MSDAAFQVIAIQASQAALFAAILYGFGRRRREDPLRYWGWSWAALFVYYVLLLTTLLPQFEPEPLRVGVRVLYGTAACCSALWLLQGTLALLDRPVRPRGRWTLLAGLLGASSGLLPLLATGPLLRSGGAWLLRCLTVGAVYLVCAALLASLAKRAGVGRILLPASFLAYGLKLLYYLAAGLADIGAGAPRRDLSVLAISDVALQAAMGLGTIVWLLEREHERLKELDRLKSDLLANVSHELRTPLTAILGYTELMLGGSSGPVSDAQARALAVVRRNGERLSKSIGALLDYSRLEAGRALVASEPFALRQLIEQALAPLRPAAARLQLTLAWSVEDGLPAVLGDREKLAQVLENLVVNAMKFTPAGGRIEVTVRRYEGAGRGLAELRVSDTGIGIQADLIESIFERFFQVDSSASRRFGGVGLGLAIVKAILDAHGAPIHVESQLGRGTTFRFALPLLEHAALPQASAGKPSGATGAGLVLVVDDDPEAQGWARAQLEPNGFAVLSALTAEQGAELALRHHPDLVVLDVLLPDRSGFDLLQSLKADPGTRDIPVLVVSATNEPLRALSLGAAECLRKPVESDAVIALARRLLAQGRTAAAAPALLAVDDQLGGARP